MMRRATSNDVDVICDIYNASIMEGGFTGDLKPLSRENRRQWFLDHQDRYSVFVKVVDGRVVGHVALSPYRKGRGAFEGVCEISYYIYKKFRGLGLGQEMIDHALDHAERTGFRLVVAIALATNRRSLAVLEKFGFSVSGILPKAAEINGEYIDHIYLHRLLSDPKA
jgi:L-amino acid N-acyltransferase YncA